MLLVSLLCASLVVPAQSQSARITGFSLLNADTHQVIQPLRNGDDIDLFRAGTTLLSIRAEVSGSLEGGSVQMILNGRVRNVDVSPPYSLGGDNNNNNNAQYESIPELAQWGGHSVQARIMEFPDGTGNVQDSRSIGFAIRNSDPNAPTAAPVTPEPTAPWTGESISPSTGDGDDFATAAPTASNVQTPTTPTSTVASPFPTAPPVPVRPLEPTDVHAYPASVRGTLSGTLEPWSKLTLCFLATTTDDTSATATTTSAFTHERNETVNPFTDIRLDVTFTALEEPVELVVPGYYAADGHAAHTHATAGAVWCVHATLPSEGSWMWRANFWHGINVALFDVNHGGVVKTPLFPVHGSTGQFILTPTTANGDDEDDLATGRALANATTPRRTRGRLQYVGEHAYKYPSGNDWWLSFGAASPSNGLAYDRFDGTTNAGERRKSWTPHADDYVSGNPTWAGGQGRELVGGTYVCVCACRTPQSDGCCSGSVWCEGCVCDCINVYTDAVDCSRFRSSTIFVTALNYLASQSLNLVTFSTLTLGGPDGNVFPFVSPQPSDRFRMDVSKLAQWEVVFQHADELGLLLNLRLESESAADVLDGKAGVLGLRRRLYYREMIARFGHHLSLIWNLGTATATASFSTANQQSLTNYIRSVDPYEHPVVLQTPSNQQAEVYEALLSSSNVAVEGTSLASDLYDTFNDTLIWRSLSAEQGHKWVVTSEYQGSQGATADRDDPTHDEFRVEVLWGNLLAGGTGVAYHFGDERGDSSGCSDLACQDWRSREALWGQSRYALEFFRENSIPFWNMGNSNERCTDGNRCFSNDEFVVVQVRRTDIPSLVDLTTPSPIVATYSLKWFDPLLGGPLQDGSVASVSSGPAQDLGTPPTSTGQEWIALLTRNRLPPTTAPTISLAPTQSPLLVVVPPTHAPHVPGTPTGTPIEMPSFRESDFLSRTIEPTSGPPSEGVSSAVAPTANISAVIQWILLFLILGLVRVNP
jgi:hypothetical protein